jgi:hypothetical protein
LWSWRVTTDLPLPFTSESFLSVIFQKLQIYFSRSRFEP